MREVTEKAARALDADQELRGASGAGAAGADQALAERQETVAALRAEFAAANEKAREDLRERAATLDSMYAATNAKAGVFLRAERERAADMERQLQSMQSTTEQRDLRRERKYVQHHLVFASDVLQLYDI